MVFGFGSSSSSSSSSSSTTNEGIERPAPTREERKACWTSRDLYFGCLDKNNVLQAGDEIQKDAKGKEIINVCGGERGSMSRIVVKHGINGVHVNHIHCLQIDYFNKRRTLELRRQATIDAAERSGNKDKADAWRAVSGGGSSGR